MNERRRALHFPSTGGAGPPPSLTEDERRVSGSVRRCVRVPKERYAGSKPPRCSAPRLRQASFRIAVLRTARVPQVRKEGGTFGRLDK